MKNGLVFIFILSFLAFAAEKYGVYDLQGNRISTFEADPHELPEKVRKAKEKESGRNLYVSSLSKGKSSKPSSRYRYKTERGAYIEATRNETFSLCPPDKKTEGTWISEHSVALDEKNCVSVQTPDLAGTFRVLFLQNSGLIDTIQVLVDQSYIQMGDYSHKIWIPDSMPWWCKNRYCEFPADGHYENRTYKQPLIVDKTKFTTSDAQYYSENSNIELLFIEYLKEFANSEKIDGSKLPYTGYIYESWKLANARSKNEGFDTAYHIVDIRSYGSDFGKLVFLSNPDASNIILAIDTSASGYRVPFDEEWFFLMRAGASTRYYWGDEEDSLTVSRYAWIRPIGLKPVAQRLPNGFGLYDMIGLTNYELIELRSFRLYNATENDFREFRSNPNHNELGMSSCGGYDVRDVSPECIFIRRLGTLIPRPLNAGKSFTDKTCVSESGKTEECTGRKIKKVKSTDTWTPQGASYLGLRLLRKTPKLHKLEKF